MTSNNTNVLFPDADAPGPALHNGAYTVAHEKHGHFTVKLYTATRGDLSGKRIVALLMGPSNEHDWKGVGFWNEDPFPHVAVWSKHCSRTRDRIKFPIDGESWGEKWTRIEKKLAIWTDLALHAYSFTGSGLELRERVDPAAKHEFVDGRLTLNGKRAFTSWWSGEGYTLLLEGRCLVCNRRLTNPESIRLGIGPECRSKI